MTDLQNDTEKLEEFVQGNCYVIYRTHLHTHTHRNVTCCHSFFLELQNKLKAEDDMIRAGES